MLLVLTSNYSNIIYDYIKYSQIQFHYVDIYYTYSVERK